VSPRPASLWVGGPLQWKMLDGEVRVRAVLDLGTGGHMEIGYAREPLLDRHSKLAAGQVGSDTAVDPAEKAK